ncbi:HD domain-containing protein [Thiomicrorhabdus sp. 6S2-11]|uniref:HD domain-containing protein n=1 Tax=Thiomicrorhabdus marina TaxID=2818442 RepID=A0ABS3Q653_9GAMM|nr:HD domain-containing phosphohydrolase [Thiomicrorhabdus marina]MBO1927618.1 HD domain-containing protein [Thiomicrorhabdus marina]
MRHRFSSITEDLLQLHEAMRKRWPGLLRVAIALYDEQKEMLHTFIKSSPDTGLLNHYSIKLQEVPSLVKLAESGEARLIQDLEILKDHHTVHSDAIAEHFKSSYTEPFYMAEKLLGFIFYDADEVGYFDDDLLEQIQNYSRLIESLIVSEMLPVKALIGMIDTAKELTNLRDSETGKHLIRVARFTEIIALQIADKYDLSDEIIEYMYHYAPLHDIGKIAIPDNILLKPGPLEDAEYDIMKTHVDEGLKMVDRMVNHFSFQQIHHLQMLKDIIGDHHEHYDGAGYPKGKKGNEISLVGRITAVADVFDALTSDRIYRKAMPVDEVIAYMKAQKGKQFDSECVDALLVNLDTVLEIIDKFKE